MMRRLVIVAVAALAMLALPALGGPRSAFAVDPGPQQFALLQPAAAGCPVGIEVTIDPGNQNPGTALFINPGPQQTPPNPCAPGIAVFRNPGPPSTPGQTFGLPLNAADCADGTAALQGLLRTLGGEPGSGPPAGPASAPSSDPCPAGTAAMQGIEDTIRLVLANPGPSQCPAGTVRTGPLGRGTFVLKNPGPNGCPAGTALGVVQNAVGTAWGFLTLVHPPNPNSPAVWEFDWIRPSGVPGESLLMPVGGG